MTIALEWPTQLQAVWSDDLADYTAAIATMWAEVEQYQSDPTNDIVSWQVLFDVDLAPLQALPWLAQCVGERLMVGFDEATSRDWIRQSPNWSRGTEQGIVNAIKRTLTGPQTVQFGTRTHLDGTVDVDCIAILTYASQTPNPEQVRNQLRRVVPADIIWEYDVVDGATWELVQGNTTDWTNLEATYGPRWADVAGAQPGFNVW
jgi:hypothetical protein